MSPRKQNESILKEAERLTTKVRNKEYGSASESFTRTGIAMGALLHLDRDLTPQEFAFVLQGPNTFPVN